MVDCEIWGPQTIDFKNQILAVSPHDSYQKIIHIGSQYKDQNEPYA